MIPRKGKKAFTLMEVLISTLLILLITVVLFTSLSTTISYLRYITELRTVTLILQEQMSKTRDLKYADIQALGGTFTSSAIASLNNAAGTLTRASYGGAGEMSKISYRIDWTSYFGKPTYKTLVTVMTDHGINKK